MLTANPLASQHFDKAIGDGHVLARIGYEDAEVLGGGRNGWIWHRIEPTIGVGVRGILTGKRVVHHHPLPCNRSLGPQMVTPGTFEDNSMQCSIALR